MSEIELQKLVGEIVRRVLQEGALGSAGAALSTASPAPLGRVLVGVCCGDCVPDEVAGALAALKAANYQVTQPEEDELKKRANRERLVAEHDVLLLPAMGDDDAAKMALGIFDEPVARLALCALATGKPLLAALNAPYDNMIQQHSPVLRRVFEGHRRVLQNYGFNIVERSQIAEQIRAVCAPQLNAPGNGSTAIAASNGKKQLITVKEIENAARDGRRLQLPPGALVTPLARDRARELGIQLD